MPGRPRIPTDPASLLSVTYGPPLWRAVALLAGALVSAAGALVIPEFWALTAVLGGLAVRDVWCRRALELTGDGFRYVVGLRHESAAWIDVVDVRVRQERHFLAFGRMLEIDLSDETLIVLSHAQLGADPDEVADAAEQQWQQALRSAKPF